MNHIYVLRSRGIGWQYGEGARKSATRMMHATEPTGSPERSAMHPDIDRVLYPAEDIAARTAELGRQLALDYREKAPLVVSTLKGSVLFFSDLVRSMMPVPDGMRLEFIRAKSYHGDATVSSGRVEVSMSTLGATDVAGRHILLVRHVFYVRQHYAWITCSPSRAPLASAADSNWQETSVSCLGPDNPLPFLTDVACTHK